MRAMRPNSSLYDGADVGNGFKLTERGPLFTQYRNNFSLAPSGDSVAVDSVESGEISSLGVYQVQRSTAVLHVSIKTEENWT